MKPLFPPPSTSEVRRILAPYFEMALDVPQHFGALEELRRKQA